MAGFNTAVTGIKASQTDLDVTGNNIANASTVGFKTSRTEFGDLYATAVVGAGSANVAGSGVTVADIAQDFQAGTIEFTNNNLDLAINGSGFFQLDDGKGGVTYTRAGSFELDKDGNVVSKSGKLLQGYGLDADGNQLPIGNLSVTQTESPPKATEDIDLSFNIDSREDESKLASPYDKDQPSTFTYSTTVRTFDSLGNEHTIKYNFAEQRPVREVQTLDFNVLTGNADISGQTVSLSTLRSLGGIPEEQVFTLAAGGVASDGGVSINVPTRLGTTVSVPVAVKSTDDLTTTTNNIVAALNREALPGGDLDGIITSASVDSTTGQVTVVYDVAQENLATNKLTFGTVGSLPQGIQAQEATVDEVGDGGILSFAITGDATANSSITVQVPIDDASPTPATQSVTVNYIYGATKEEISQQIVTDINAALGGWAGEEIEEVRYNSATGRIEIDYDAGTAVGDSMKGQIDLTFGARTPPSSPGHITFAAATTDVAFVDGANAQTEANKIITADPRIAEITVDRTNNDLIVRFKSEATDVDPIQVGNLTAATLDKNTSTELASNEVHTYQINNGAFDTDGLITETLVTVGGVEIQLDKGMDEEEIANAILAREAQIKDRLPELESVAINNTGSNFEISFTFKPEANVDEDVLSLNAGDVSSTTKAVPVLSNLEVVDGDNSYQGVYRMFAYLNGEEQLDIGKVVDPGENGFANNQTEVGPVILKFNSTNGLLSSINGTTFSSGGTAPSITITGADPANPLTKITLDLTGSTQFSSASIVKSSAQDGYTKGDLVGVTFSETGQMVASFSNGQNQSLAVVAIATFENQSGLQPSGNTEWSATLTSGDAIVNPPGTGLNGTLRSAALEQSNVDLSAELVSLIEAQRNFQANSKTIETQNTITQNILQI